ncbi:MAG TPA: carboxypeptidase regulatory-like domain-containing protein, partial [Terriglobia bacterium]|nr:carboxypeptidase regulatory-like domain-containing protein [Terriglobia bacterium]
MLNSVFSDRWSDRSRNQIRAAATVAIAAVGFLLAFAVSSARAQVYSASMTGRVTDPSGAVIPGAQVTATNVSNGFTYPATTNSAGVYTIENLPPSTYKLSVTAKGFETAVRPGIALVVSQHATVNMEMRVGATTQSVTVTAAAPLLQAQDATTGQTVSRTLINDLPLVGRAVFDLAMLTPGISQPPTSVFGPNSMANNWVSNGGRNATADILIDGTSSTAPEQNTQILDPLYTPSVDAVQEFKVEQNDFSADKGFSGNTVVDVIMRSGTNQFHGSAYEFLRNSNLNANGWFNDRAGLPIAPGRNNDFGGTFGGPIQKNKTFFFMDYEGHRDASSASFTAGVPSMAERNGDFSELCGDNSGTFNSAGACSAANGQLWDPYSGFYNSKTGQRNLTAIIPNDNMAAYVSPGSSLLNGTPFALPATPGNLINPVASKMIMYYPLPNLNVGASAYNRFDNWAGTGANTDSSNQFDIKVDRQISDLTHLDARYSQSLFGTYDGANPWNNPLNTDTQGPGTDGAQSAVINVTHNFSPTLLFQASYGYTRSLSWTSGVDAAFPSFNPVTALGEPAYMETSGVSAAPTIYLDGGYTYVGAESLGAQAWSVLHYALETHDLMASLDKFAGAHEFKFGGEMRVYKDDFEQPGTPGGQFEFSQTGTSQTPNGGTGGDGLATFLTGVGGPGSWGQYEVPLGIATQNFEYAGYFQDNWHTTRKLTLNLGVRYDLYMPATERHNKQEWFDPTVVNPLSNDHLSLSSAAAADYTNAGLPVPNLSTILGGLEFTSPSQRTPVNAVYTNFSPRFGLAYQIRGNTVLRGGYGIFYSVPDYTAHGTGLGSNDGFLQDTGWLTTYQGNGFTPWASLSNPFPAANFTTAPPGGLILPPGSSEGLATDLGVGVTGYLRNWNAV